VLLLLRRPSGCHAGLRCLEQPPALPGLPAHQLSWQSNQLTGSVGLSWSTGANPRPPALPLRPFTEGYIAPVLPLSLWASRCSLERGGTVRHAVEPAKAQHCVWCAVLQAGGTEQQGNHCDPPPKILF